MKKNSIKKKMNGPQELTVSITKIKTNTTLNLNLKPRLEPEPELKQNLEQKKIKTVAQTILRTKMRTIRRARTKKSSNSSKIKLPATKASTTMKTRKRNTEAITRL